MTNNFNQESINNFYCTILEDKMHYVYLLIIDKALRISNIYIRLEDYMDMSLNKFRYNEFIFELVKKADIDILNHKLYMPNGEYSYFIFHTDSTIVESDVNKYIKQGNFPYDILESGKIKVK
jgi:hypothetical protein